jgi:hypothetical protein
MEGHDSPHDPADTNIGGGLTPPGDTTASPPPSRVVINTSSLISRDDDSEIETTAKAPRRGRRIALAAGAVAVLAGGTLAVTQPWSDDDTSTLEAPDNSTDDDGDDDDDTDATLPEPDISARWLLTDIPEGYRLTSVFDPNNMPEGQGPFPMEEPRFGTVTQYMFTGPDATFEDGPFIAVTASLIDQFEREDFDAIRFVQNYQGDASQFRAVTINEFSGAIGTNWDQTKSLLWGVLEEGFVVSIAYAGVDESDVLAIAEGITLEVDGKEATPVFDGAVADAGLEPFAESSQPNWGGINFGVNVPLYGQGNNVNVSYSDETAGRYTNLNVFVSDPSVDLVRIAKFWLADAEDATIHGQPAVFGATPSNFGSGDLIVWSEGGRTFVLSSDGASRDGPTVAELAEDFAEVDEDAWLTAIEEAAQFQGGFNGVSESWIVAVGDADDSSTWIIEANIVDEVVFWCTWLNTSDGSSGGGCQSAGDVEVPSLSEGPLIGWNGQVPTIVAQVPFDEPGWVLRYTTDDGGVTDVPVVTTRDGWGAALGALLPTAAGTAELIDPAGAVVDTLELSDDDYDFDLGTGIDFAPAATMAVGG